MTKKSIPLSVDWDGVKLGLGDEAFEALEKAIILDTVEVIEAERRAQQGQEKDPA